MSLNMPINKLRSDQRGIAMIIALFMMLAMSVMGSSLMFVAQTETASSMNYRLMSQARYGAESGVHKAANYLLSTAYTSVAPGTADNAVSQYTLTQSPVRYNNAAVVLSADSTVPNYPVAAVSTAFAAAATGTLDVGDTTVTYAAHAQLIAMRQIFDEYDLVNKTLETWEITATGTIAGPHPAEVEVSAIVERQPAPIYSYAAFATYNGCAALSFAGGATTNSYDSLAALVGGAPATNNYGGNVGTNGNLTEVGNPTTIYGSLSTPRSGVGACTANNVTAQTISGQASVSAGLTQLSQEIQYPTPVIPDPGTGSQNFTQNGGCPAGVSYCTAVSSGADQGAIITPPSSTTEVLLGDVTVNGNGTLTLNPGIYVVNSIDIAGNSKIKIPTGATGPVIFKVKGNSVATPIKIEGNGISNPGFVPSNLVFQYAGTGAIQIAGGTDTAALFYAPNASASIAGGADLYGSIVVNKLTATGGASIHYDRRLSKYALTVGSYMMSAFTWKNFEG